MQGSWKEELKSSKPRYFVTDLALLCTGEVRSWILVKRRERHFVTDTWGAESAILLRTLGLVKRPR